MIKKSDKKVLMLCTGGTIGMLHKVKDDTTTPLVPAKWEELEEFCPALKDLPFHVETMEMVLIDSSDMHPGYWVELAKIIQEVYANFHGFVILHGTDTMTYTATALSFLLENLDKPVIVTGSQLPLAKARNDAAQNLVTALILAASEGIPLVPEVCVLFNNVLLRGNRTRKVSSTGFAGFDSPNYGKLAEIGEHIKINTSLIRSPSREGFFVNEFLDANVMLFDIFPGINTRILENIFSDEELKGVVFRTYGAGNAPSDSALMKQIEVAVKKGIAVVNITQCVQGMVEMGLYDASMSLLRIGVISGVDMTPEAALVKMMFLIGQGYDPATVKDQMQRNLRGEQSVNVFNFIYGKGQTIDGVSKQKTQQIPSNFTRDKIVKANIRFEGVKIPKVKENPSLALFLNYPQVSVSTSVGIPQCLGIIESIRGNMDVMLECTQKVNQVISPGRPVQLSVVAQNGDVSWNSIVFSIYTDVDD
jgi:L-asparaginase